MKEKVIIEEVDNSEKVCINYYDESNDTIYDGGTVLLKKEVFKKYDVVGEIINGMINLYKPDYEEEGSTYEQFYQIEDDDA